MRCRQEKNVDKQRLFCSQLLEQRKVQLICSINNVRLYDHCILAPDGIFSYFMSNRLDEIAHDYSVGVFFNGKHVTDKF